MGYLKAAVETVASFGKPVGVSSETGQAKAEEAPISNGTVTKTVTEVVSERGLLRKLLKRLERAMGFEPHSVAGSALNLLHGSCNT